MKNIYFIICFLLTFSFADAQTIVNAYARVSNISGEKKVLTITNVNETADTFEANEQVVIMQMQDDVIGGTSNTSSFGNLGDIRAAGQYEIRTIEEVIEPSWGQQHQIRLNQPLQNTYRTTNNSSVQIISFPKLGNPDYTTTSNITALDWNGNVGGVVAFDVDGTLNLKHNISANAKGFRGGNRAQFVEEYCLIYLFGSCWWSNTNPQLTCNTSQYANNAEYGYYANKGEGIYKKTSNNYNFARGKILNGAGGANQNNAGGGGGGNLTAGGEGGVGYNGGSGCSGSGGLGGIALENHITAERVFMGGGGGGGQGDNNNATNGADGGGIILIKANKIKTSGSGNSVKISANGESSQNSGNDGAGGAGAGGSIVFHVFNWEIAASKPLTLEAKGGNGGSVANSSAIHGGGGGGGKGVVIHAYTTPTTNISTNTDVGKGGCNNNANDCVSRARDGQNENLPGVIEGSIGPLPIELLKFTAEKAGLSRVKFYWETATETNNDYFSVERSSDAENWESIARIEGAGNSNSLLNYNAEDLNPEPGINYYRLKQTDFNGSSSVSDIQSVNFFSTENIKEDLLIYPNPATNEINVVFQEDEQNWITMYNSSNEPIEVPYSVNGSILTFNTTALPAGVYFVNLVNNTYSVTKRVVLVR